MRRAFWIVLLGAAALAAVRLAVWRPFPVASQSPSDASQVVSGVVHVHTTLSDGRGTPEQTIEAAKAAGLDFIVITDHNTFDASRFEGYSGKLLIIAGSEISTRQGHVLVFGLKEPAFRFSDDASEVLDDVHALGATAIVAHPDSPRPDFRWTAWEAPGAWGIEVLNGDTEWRSIGWLRTARLLVTYPLNPTYALLGILSRPDRTLDRWDRLLANRHVPMLAGADAHGFPSYEPQFRVAQNHLVLNRPLTGEARADTAEIVAALARGRGYVGIDGLAPARGFSLVARQGDRQWTMGDVAPVDPPPHLHAGGALPDGATLRLFHDGRMIKESAGRLDWPNATAGVYRVEVRLPRWDVPWILSNPVYVFDPEVQAVRTRVSPPIVPEPVQILERFESADAFQPASDETTVLDGDIFVPAAGDTGAAARMRFTLGTPNATTPSPFAALTSLRSRNLSGRRGLVFSVRGDDVRRLWVQVRDENPRSEGGTEWWYASVRTSTEWRRVVVPFERFRSLDERTDGRLDLKDTRGLVFLVDLGAAKPGTRGEIWLDDIGVY